MWCTCFGTYDFETHDDIIVSESEYSPNTTNLEETEMQEIKSEPIIQPYIINTSSIPEPVYRIRKIGDSKRIVMNVKSSGKNTVTDH